MSHHLVSLITALIHFFWLIKAFSVGYVTKHSVANVTLQFLSQKASAFFFARIGFDFLLSYQLSHR